jgi:hypothetical protein
VDSAIRKKGVDDAFPAHAFQRQRQVEKLYLAEWPNWVIKFALPTIVSHDPTLP